MERQGGIKKNVCVIGGGSSGLIALRHVTSDPDVLTGTLFEQSDHIGGIWHYDDHQDFKGHPNGEESHPTVYKSLRMNLPKDVMSMLDFPFPKREPAFATHEEVDEYFHIYANHFNLFNHIRLNTRVTSVKPILNSRGDGETVIAAGEDKANPNSAGETKWLVSTMNMETLEEETMEFDAVIICSGFYCKPSLPKIENIDQFEGEQIHSCQYRTPESFRNKSVMVFGGGFSASDIATELIPVAKEIFVSMDNSQLAYLFQGGIRIVGKVQGATKTGVVLDSGEKVDCDVIIFCTGYKYAIPFLDDKCGVTINLDGKKVAPLYKHLVHSKYPSLCFVGLPIVCPSFYMFDIQMKYYVKYLQGSMKLPSEQEMNEWLQKDSEMRAELGLRTSQSHQLGPLQWEYYETMAREAGFENQLRPVVRRIYEAVAQRRHNSPRTYKNDLIWAVDDISFRHQFIQ